MRKASYDRYRRGLIVPGDRGRWLWARRRVINTNPRSDDVFHTVREGERLDLLAWKYLNDARLWWVIAEYNNLLWFFDAKPGQELRIPSYEHTHMDLLT